MQWCLRRLSYFNQNLYKAIFEECWLKLNFTMVSISDIDLVKKGCLPENVGCIRYNNDR